MTDHASLGIQGPAADQSGPALRRNIDHARHANRAVRSAEVRIRSGLRESELVNRACVGKSSRLAVSIVRRTKLSIDRARIAPADTMTAASPGPPNCVARVDGNFVRHKREPLPHCDIESPAVAPQGAVVGLGAA
jgi:hypothetical protein